MRLSIPFLLLALLMSGCTTHFRQTEAMGDWYVKNPAQAESFFDGLKTKLASEGFDPCDPPSWHQTTSDHVYWFEGSYKKSPGFYLVVGRDGPYYESFHLEYECDMASVFPEEEMKELSEKTEAFRESLTDWARSGKLADIPPGS